MHATCRHEVIRASDSTARRALKSPEASSGDFDASGPRQCSGVSDAPYAFRGDFNMRLGRSHGNFNASRWRIACIPRVGSSP